VNTVLENNNNKKKYIQEYTIPCLFTWEWPKQIWNYSSDDYDLWNLKLSYLNQFWWIIIIEV
jgi:hypothetical protein